MTDEERVEWLLQIVGENMLRIRKLEVQVATLTNHLAVALEPLGRESTFVNEEFKIRAREGMDAKPPQSEAT